MTKIIKIFVYGSLMEGFWNYEKSLVGKCLSITDAQVKGKLFHLPHKGYPALIAGEDQVRGQLIEIEDNLQLIQLLDEIEDYKENNEQVSEYFRHKKMVICNQQEVMAYVYEYNHVLDPEFSKSAIYIKDGDWRKFMQGVEQER
ncbi:MAG: gamma-glutamylcyclotransferase family protein [Mycoplasmatales bacterium]